MRILILSFFFAVAAFADTVLVDDPDHIHYAELPSGNVILKTYRATDALIEAYGKDTQIDKPDSKDNPKAPDCTRAEIHALKDWASQSTYWFVNKTLREVKKGKVEGKLVEPKMDRLIRMISSGVNCAPQWEGAVVRGERTPDDVLEEYQPGNYVLMRAFTSTSKGTEIADTIPWVSRIVIEKATGADIDSLGIAEFPQEREVLIRPGTVFKVLTRKPVPDTFPARWLFDFEPF